MAKGTILDVYMVDSVGAHRGMHYYNFALTAAMIELGARPVLISVPETTSHPLRPAGVQTRTGFTGIYGDSPRWVRGLRYGLSLLRIAWWARRERPQIVHFHFYQIPILDYILLYGLQLLGIKTITTVHDVLPFERGVDFASERGNNYRRLYELSSGLILHSKFAWESLTKLDPNLLAKSTLIPHGSFACLFKDHVLSSDQARTDLDIEANTPVILVFGTIKPNKRLDLVIESMARLLVTCPQARLIVAGKPKDRDIADDQALAERLGVTENILWRLDYLTDEELVTYICAADVVVFPYEWVYQSGALLMAMSFGKAVVATAVGSNVDLIRHEQTGILVSLDDPDVMADAIGKILDDPTWAMTLGDAAYEYVSRELAWESIAEATLAYYKRVNVQQ